MRILTVILLSFFLAISPFETCGRPVIPTTYHSYSTEELTDHFYKVFKYNDCYILYVDCSLSEKFELVEYAVSFGIHPDNPKMVDKDGYFIIHAPVGLSTTLKYNYKGIDVEIMVTAGTENKEIKLEEYVELGGGFPYQWQHKDSLDTYDNLIEIYIVFESESGLTNDDCEIIYEEIKDDIFKCLKVVNRSDFYDDILE